MRFINPFAKRPFATFHQPPENICFFWVGGVKQTLPWMKSNDVCQMK